MRNLYHADGCNTLMLKGGLESHISTGPCGFPSTSAPYFMSNVIAVLSQLLDAN